MAESSAVVLAGAPPSTIFEFSSMAAEIRAFAFRFDLMENEKDGERN